MGSRQMSANCQFQREKASVLCPSFFPPLRTVLAWMGNPPSAVSQAKKVADEFGIELPSERTLRHIERTGRIRPKTNDAVTKFETDLVLRLRAKSSVPLVGPESRILKNWQVWLGVADYTDVNLPVHWLPRTRNHIRWLANRERRMVNHFHRLWPDVAAATQYLLTNSFAQWLCREDEVPIGPLVVPASKLSTSQQFDALAKTSLFRRWHAHCVVSLLLSILAQTDLEISRTLRESASIVGPILPRMRAGKLCLPIRLLLERWREKLGSSFKKMSAHAKGASDEEDARRKLESWVNDEHDPSVESIRGLLTALVPNEQERHWAERRYRAALLLTALFRAAEHALPDAGVEERLLLFQPFYRHRRSQSEDGNVLPVPLWASSNFRSLDAAKPSAHESV